MFRYILLFCFLLHISTSVIGQTIKSDSCTIYTDSIVYEIDTIKSIDTIQHFVYGAPTDYTVFGIQSNVGKSWIQAINHQNPQNSISPEFFCHINRANSLFSIGIQYNAITEKVQYSINHTQLFDTTYTKIDTVTKFNMKQRDGSKTTIYVTKANQYSKKDSSITKTAVKNQRLLQFITIPFRYGYYIKNGYLRIDIGIGIEPIFLVSKKSDLDLYFMSTKNRVSCLIQPTIEFSYWVMSKVFLHFSCSDQQSILATTTNNNHNTYINNALASIGISFLFFDKKRE